MALNNILADCPGLGNTFAWLSSPFSTLLLLSAAFLVSASTLNQKSAAAENIPEETQCPSDNYVYLDVDSISRLEVKNPAHLKTPGLIAFQAYLSTESKKTAFNFALRFRNCRAVVFYGKIELEDTRISTLFPFSTIGRADEYVTVDTWMPKIQEAESQNMPFPGRLQIRVK